MSIIATLLASPIFVGGSGLIITGLVSFWLKELPLLFFNFLKTNFTTSMSVTSYNQSFYDLLIHFQEKYSNKNFRTHKINNGRWGEDVSKITIGYGVHYFNYNGTYIKVSFEKMETKDRTDKEIITITKFGRSKKLFDVMLQSIKPKDDKIKVYNYKDGWDFSRNITKRNWSSIYIEKEKKDTIIETISEFKNNKEWYIKHGVPYQLGFLLKGPPGTGKTSIIKAIASEFNFPIYYLSVSDLKDIQVAFSSIPDNALVVLEDIDSNKITHNREDTEQSDNQKITLSEVLNSIDGLFSSSGRVLVMTSNHAEVLDPALVRPGRIDLQIEIGYIKNEILEQFVETFYGVSIGEVTVKENVTVAQLQQMVLMKKKVEELMKEVCL